ncbi:MAG TPA: hypothetical protein VHE81_03850 [Lacipirellulaceae bacterium]|nr:hypothetical protein [Lacipirellulaceae bacterium]
MSIAGEILKAVGSLAGKAAVEVVKAGYQVGKTTGKGAVNGTAAVVKEIAKKATGN